VLSVSYNKGITWIKIAQVALNDGFYVWTPPIVFKQCLLKMDIGNKSVLSDPFVISTPLNLGVGYNCTDGALLQWNGQTNCIGYNLYNIKNSNLQFIASTTDTALVIPAALKSSNYFAVSAIGPGGFEGVRSLTTDITMQGVGCYVKTLLADVVNGTVRLTLNLGTVFQLKKITWEKEWGVNKFTQLGSTLINTNKLNYIFFDKNIKLGIQYYRVTLEMTDGTKIESDLASAIFISNNEFVVYPIPCTDYLNILSGSTDTYEIDIFDTAGKKVINQTLQGLEQQLYLKNLGAGVYIGVIYIKGLKKYVSKIIKI